MKLVLPTVLPKDITKVSGHKVLVMYSHNLGLDTSHPAGKARAGRHVG
jgi:hypothetical protein